jgi:O-antigen biosynthesis protein
MSPAMGTAPAPVIELPSAADPLVSVVVLLTREAELAERCLRAIADGHERDVPTEVVLVLGAPDADTLALVDERVGGARIVRSPVNTGTGGGWNLGFGAARGRWIALLHEDSEPEPGWLGPLLDTAAREPRAAVVGSRLVWSDGEEAGRLWNRGNIMWSDGMPGHLTDDAVDQDGPYVCDHCSSAAAMFERDAWQAVGGFDERYFPAVRHELDLCIALWRSGRTVMCDPRSTVRHRGAAMVRPDAGVLESWEFGAFLADRSRRLLLEKWGEALAAYQERPPEHPPGTAELRRARERTVRRAAEQAAPVDGSPRSVRPLTAPDGGWPDAVDADMERRLVAAQVAVQAEFCDTLAVASRAQGARLNELEQELAALRPKAHTHDLMLAGRWWRLRRRIEPAVRAAGWILPLAAFAPGRRQR